MKTILKEELYIKRHQTIELPQNFNILHFDNKGGVPSLWYECESTMPLVKLYIYGVGTGSCMDNLPPVTYIGTYLQDGIVCHYYRAIALR